MRTPIQLCSRYGHIDAVKELLSLHVDINAIDKVWLHLLYISYNYYIIRLLG